MNVDSGDDAFSVLLSTVSDSALRETTRDYLWLSEFGPVAGRETFHSRCATALAECRRRNMSEVIEELRSELARLERPE